MIIFLIKLYLAFVVIDTMLVVLYRYLMKRELESKEIDEITKYQVDTEDKLRDDVRSTGKTQDEVESIIDFVYNNLELIQIMLIIIPLLNIVTFIGLMRSILEIIEYVITLIVIRKIGIESSIIIMIRSDLYGYFSN